jgi:serine protease AprX
VDAEALAHLARAAHYAQKCSLPVEIALPDVLSPPGSALGDGSYDSQASEVDDFVWNHRDMLICFAAGNEGRDANSRGSIDNSSLTPPGTAKNCLTVGASENLRRTFNLTYGQGFGYPANPIASDLVADNAEGLAAFSSRGPHKMDVASLTW